MEQKTIRTEWNTAEYRLEVPGAAPLVLMSGPIRSEGDSAPLSAPADPGSGPERRDPPWTP